MATRIYILGVMAGLAALAATGCSTSQDRPYVALQDMDQARRMADLVVEGEVTGTLAADRRPVNTFAADMLGSGNPNMSESRNMDCVVKTRTTMNVTRVVKSESPVADTIRFSYESPCYAVDPDVLLGVQLPSVLNRGDKLRAYLQNRGGEFWLIAHEQWYLPPGVNPPQARWTSQGARAFEVPSAAPPATGEAVAAPPSTGAPPSTVALPSTTTPPSTGEQPAAPAAPTTPPPAPTPAPVGPGVVIVQPPSTAPQPPAPMWQVPAPKGAPNYNPGDRWWPPPK